MRYLEEQLRFVSEELSKIEGEWIRKRSLPFTDPQICDLLVRLGHILHAVEDYFFHSNFVEVWKRHNLQLLHPRHKPYDNRQDYNFLLDHLLTLNPQDTSAAALGVLLKRHFARRLRYPIFTRGTQGDPQQSEDATQFVYTGGFGANDVFHTITGALEALEEIMEEAAMHLPPSRRN